MSTITISDQVNKVTLTDGSDTVTISDEFSTMLNLSEVALTIDPNIGIEESLIGTKNGINTIFTTTYNFVTGTTRVYVNGLKEQYYTETDTNEITLDEAPISTDNLIINYNKGS